MHFILYFLPLLSFVSSEIIEPPVTKDPLSPSYGQPGLSPTYTQPAANAPSFAQPSNVQPAYQPQPDVYPTYNGGYPEYGYGYQPYPVKKNEEGGMIKTLGTILPVLRQTFHLILRFAGKVGLFLLGGAALLVVGGAFTAAVCSVTPICTFSFMGYGLSNDQVRSLMSPDKISIATNLVNEAIDKYTKLQTVIDGKN